MRSRLGHFLAVQTCSDKMAQRNCPPRHRAHLILLCVLLKFAFDLALLIDFRDGQQYPRIYLTHFC
jgi:hypothetical protein